MKKMKRLIVLMIVISFLATGCYGSFAAFNKLRSWNQKASSEKWVNEVIYLALNIIPVYGIALFADAIIFNSVAFWTGENPMEKAKFSMDGDKKAVQTFSQDKTGKQMQILYYENDQLKHTLTLSQAAGSTTFTGHLAWTDGRTENFTVETTDQGIRASRAAPDGTISSMLYTGQTLEQIRLKVARICGGMHLANAVQ